jgi:hypothetical protein
LDRRGENRTELIGLIGNRVQAVSGKQISLANNPQPGFCLAQLFETNTQLVGKISSTLGRTAFRVIRSCRRSTPYNLIGDVLSQPRFWKRVSDFSNPNRKVDKTIL